MKVPSIGPFFTFRFCDLVSAGLCRRFSFFIFATLSSMTRGEFEKLVEEEFPKAVPEKFHALIQNLAFIVEDEPSKDVRAAEHLGEDETLLGYYRGIPHTARGDNYGVGPTLPDTIVLYRLPIEDEAEHLQHTDKLEYVGMSYEEAVRKVVRETIWHEVAHFFGMDEHQVRRREDERDGNETR